MQPDAASHSSIDEDVIQRFESARRAGNCDLIEQVVPVESGPHFRPTLEELVHVDLEFAWKAQAGSAAAARVEDYLARFPQLNEPAILLRLLRDEFRLRQRCGDQPSTAEYRQRFPQVVVSGDEMVETVVGPPVDVRSDSEANQPLRRAPAPLIPGYEILEELGRGGMGVVYRARHRELDRVVAVKLMLAQDRADDHDRARFRSEGRSAARLQHPNIVQVFEVGETAGCPYLTMEFVAGAPLSRTIAEAPLTAANAARLVQQLAQAMKYAHEQGVIHRDLKPSNVLLAGDADSLSPKIADFGLAKRLEDDSGVTRTSDVLGTPSYMAPEQAAGLVKDVGPSSDVYALGATLYHILTGRPPFRAATVLDTLQLVRTQEPVPLRELQPNVPRDLETICLKCLQKEPAKRYANCADLADDLGHFLAGEPILARPVSLPERLGRWCRRNPRTAALTGSVAVLLAVLAVVPSVLAWRLHKANGVADAARGSAEKRLGLVEKANDILGSVFEQLDPKSEELGGKPLREQLSERLEKATALLDGDAVGDPLVVARLQLILGNSQRELGNYDQAAVLLTRSLETRQRLLGENHPDTLASRNGLGQLQQVRGELAQAEASFQQVADARAAGLGENHPDTLVAQANHADLLTTRGEYDRAEELFQRVLAARTETLGADHVDTLGAKNGLATVYQKQAKYDRAVELLQQVAASFTRRFGADHPDTLAALNNLAALHYSRGDYPAAEELYKQALAGRAEKLGPSHRDTLSTENNLAYLYTVQKKYELAEPLFVHVIAASTARLGADHPYTLDAKNNLGTLHHGRQQYAAAEKLYAEVLAGRVSRLGANHPDTHSVRNKLAIVYKYQKKYDAAEPLFREVLAADLAKFGAVHPETLICKNNLAMLYVSQNKFDRAEPLLGEVIDGMTQLVGPAHPNTLTGMINLATVYSRTRRYDKSVDLLEQILKRRRSKLGDDDAQTVTAAHYLGVELTTGGWPGRAMPVFSEWLPHCRRVHGPDHVSTQIMLDAAVQAAEKAQQFDQAAAYCRELQASKGRSTPRDVAGETRLAARLGSMWLRANRPTEAEGALRAGLAAAKTTPVGREGFQLQSLLGESLLRQKKYADAEPLLLDGCNGLKKDAAQDTAAYAPGGNQRQALLDAIERLVELYQGWDKKAQADVWAKQLTELNKTDTK